MNRYQSPFLSSRKFHQRRIPEWVLSLSLSLSHPFNPPHFSRLLAKVVKLILSLHSEEKKKENPQQLGQSMTERVSSEELIMNNRVAWSALCVCTVCVNLGGPTICQNYFVNAPSLDSTKIQWQKIFFSFSTRTSNVLSICEDFLSSFYDIR